MRSGAAGSWTSTHIRYNISGRGLSCYDHHAGPIKLMFVYWAPSWFQWMVYSLYAKSRSLQRCGPCPHRTHKSKKSRHGDRWLNVAQPGFTTLPEHNVVISTCHRLRLWEGTLDELRLEHCSKTPESLAKVRALAVSFPFPPFVLRWLWGVWPPHPITNSQPEQLCSGGSCLVFYFVQSEIKF